MTVTEMMVLCNTMQNWWHLESLGVQDWKRFINCFFDECREAGGFAHKSACRSAFLFKEEIGGVSDGFRCASFH
jgi:hypothetical protein